MSDEEDLKKMIEKVRKRMYKAYENKESYENILKISTDLDELLNQKMYTHTIKKNIYK